MSLNDGTVVHRECKNGTLIEIIDLGDHRSLYFSSRHLQSRMSLSSPCDLVLPYTRYMMFILLMLDAPENVLLIGVGAGSMIRFLHHHFPNCKIDAVDNSSHIIKLAHGYFCIPQHKHVAIHCRDGRDFLQENLTAERYDLILLDAFDEQGMAAGIYSAPFFQLCAQRLSADGVLCSNLWSGRPEVMAQVGSDLKEYFNGQLFIPVPKRGNVIGYSFLNSVPWNKINRSKSEYNRLEQQFTLDFREMAMNARKHNLKLHQRLAALF